MVSVSTTEAAASAVASPRPASAATQGGAREAKLLVVRDRLVCQRRHVLVGTIGVCHEVRCWHHGMADGVAADRVAAWCGMAWVQHGMCGLMHLPTHIAWNAQRATQQVAAHMFT